jgi:outer membrane protein assembly factor BamB
MMGESTRRRLLAALGAGAAATAGCIALPGGSEDVEVGPAELSGTWPAFGADVRNTGHADTTGPADPVEAWTFDTTGPIHDGVAVADGTVFVGSSDGTLYALDAETGEERWRFPVRGQVRTTPAVASGLAFVGGRGGGLYALDTDSGGQRWAALQSTGFSLSHPTVLEGTVYAGSNDGTLYAVDAESGDVEWDLDVGGDVASSPAIADDTIYVGWRGPVESPDDQENGGLTAVSTGGEAEWTVTPGAVDGSPAVVDGVVYAVSRSAAHAFDAATGDERWSFEDAAGAGSPAVRDGTVYVGSYDLDVHALDAETGDLEWDQRVGKWPTFAPAIADGVVYVPSWSDRIYGLDAATGEPRWRHELATPLSDPAVADGRVYVATGNTLVALRDE